MLGIWPATMDCCPWWRVQSAPGRVLQGNVVLGAGSMPEAPRFDEQAAYAGAFAPGTVPWTDGWTSYPEG